MGCTRENRLLVVFHTYTETVRGMESVRLISARFATLNERHQYESGE